MANTTISTMFATTAVLALAACGGGGATSNVPPTSTPNLTDEVSVNIRNHISGQKIYIGNTGEPNEMTRFSATMTDQSILEQILSGESDPEITDFSEYTPNNPFGEVYYFVLSFDGKSYDAATYIDTRSDEDVSVLALMSDELPNFIAIGDQLTSMPIGEFRYRGGVLQTNSFGQLQFDSGIFFMDANFNTASANFLAEFSGREVRANNISIDMSTGTFSSDDLLVYQINNNVSPVLQGQLDGTFTGVNASGVVGVYSTTGGTISGSFSGIR